MRRTRRRRRGWEMVRPTRVVDIIFLFTGSFPMNWITNESTRDLGNWPLLMPVKQHQVLYIGKSLILKLKLGL